MCNFIFQLNIFISRSEQASYEIFNFFMCWFFLQKKKPTRVTKNWKLQAIVTTIIIILCSSEQNSNMHNLWIMYYLSTFFLCYLVVCKQKRLETANLQVFYWNYWSIEANILNIHILQCNTNSVNLVKFAVAPTRSKCHHYYFK